MSQNKMDSEIKSLRGKTYRILVACGTGIATSNAAAAALRSRLEALGIRAEFTMCRVIDAPEKSKSGNYDLLVSTAGIPEGVAIPAISGVPFLTGIGIDEAVNQIIDILRKLNKIK